MISLNSEQTCLLELIKASLFDLTPEISESVNWESVFESAKKQCLVPMVISSVPAEYRNEWSILSARYKAYFMQMLYAQKSLVKLLCDNNIQFIILKGTAASIYYPNPLLRTFGDIDFYVTEETVGLVENLLRQNGYVFVSNDDRHYEFEKYGIDFELHFRFSCNYYNDIEDVVLNGMNNAVEYKIYDTTFYSLPTYENGLVILGHIMQHLKDSGIGLRQIIDWMMFVHNELDDSAWEKHFRQLAVNAGLEKLAITVTFMCRKWLGLHKEITWCDIADEEVADQVLFRILDDGNFGSDRAPYENIRRFIKNEGFFKYLQHSGLSNWPLAQKYKFLRPLAWLYQICKFLGQGFVRLFTGKKVFRKNKKNLSLEELWKELE